MASERKVRVPGPCESYTPRLAVFRGPDAGRWYPVGPPGRTPPPHPMAGLNVDHDEAGAGMAKPRMVDGAGGRAGAGLAA
jgi:hypothetical protein